MNYKINTQCKKVLAIVGFFCVHLSLFAAESLLESKKIHHVLMTEKLPLVNQESLEILLKKLDAWFAEVLPYDDDEHEAEETQVESSEHAEPPSVSDMLSMLEKELASHGDLSPEIRYLIVEAYRVSYEEERAGYLSGDDNSDDYLAWCDCHPRSLRIAFLIKVISEVTQKFTDRGHKITATILAPGNLLQEYVFVHLLMNVLGYQHVELHCIDLSYNDPQFDPVSFRIDKTGNVRGPRFKKLTTEQEFKEKMGAEKQARKKALKEYIASDKPLKRLVKLINKLSFALEYFRHSYSYLSWAKSRKIKAQVILMFDPYPVAYALNKYIPPEGQETLFKRLTTEESFAATYPSNNNALLCGVRQKFDQFWGNFPFVIIHPHTPHAPSILYAEQMYTQKYDIEPTFSDPIFNTLFHKNMSVINALIDVVKKYPHQPTPWSDIYEPLYKILGEKVPGGTTKKGKKRSDVIITQEYVALACEPYIAFEDIAQAISLQNTISYWSFNIETLPPPGSEKGANKIYTKKYDFEVEKKHLAAGIAISEIDEYLRSMAYVKVWPLAS